MEWQNKIFWQPLKAGDEVWHVDDATQGALLTLCGEHYDMRLPEVYQKPEGKKVCSECETRLVRLLLQLGLPGKL